MKKHGLNSECFKVVFSSIVVSKILYVLPASRIVASSKLQQWNLFAFPAINVDWWCSKQASK